MLALAAVVGAAAELRGFTGTAPAQGPPLQSYLDRYVTLPPGQRARLLGGAAISGQLDGGDPSTDVGVFGAVWIEAPISRYLSAVRDIERLESGSSFRITRKISSPPRLDDFAALTLPAPDVRDLQTCRVARCELKLSRDTIERLQRDVVWSRGDVQDQVNRVTRQAVLDYVAGYLEGGNARLAVYRDSERPTLVAAEFRSLVDRSPALAQMFPDVRRYLLEFPAASLPGSESFLYWQETKFGLKPTIRINHVVIVERGDVAIVASKMIYATHYFRSALELRILLRDPAHGNGFWLITENRSRSDGLGGLSGRLIRGRVRGASERGTATILEQTKARLEGR